MTLHVVVGPPCAGKSTYVWSGRASGDLAIDFDRLASALGAPVSHDAEGDVREAAFAARAAAIRVAMTAESDAWIIHTSPTSKQVSQRSAASNSPAEALWQNVPRFARNSPFSPIFLPFV